MTWRCGRPVTPVNHASEVYRLRDNKFVTTNSPSECILLQTGSSDVGLPESAAHARADACFSYSFNLGDQGSLHVNLYLCGAFLCSHCRLRSTLELMAARLTSAYKMTGAVSSTHQATCTPSRSPRVCLRRSFAPCLPPHKMSPTRVAVIGAGMAGPALAIFLKQKGYEPVVFERHGSVTDNGLGIA